MKHYIAEIDSRLNDRELEIWEGRSGLAPHIEERYRARWRGEAAPPASKEAKTPACQSLGKPTGELIASRRCKLDILQLHHCEKHGKVTIERAAGAEGIMCCRWCPDNPAKLEEKRKAEAIIAAAKAERERDADYQRQADEFVKCITWYPGPPNYSVNKFHGRGITIAAGGKYWASAYVTVRMLRHVGCTLPIQVWYLGGSGERDERYESLLAPFGVSFVDIDTHSARKHRRGVKGFQTKLFAVINSPFEEVLSLDPDCYPCDDPTALFDHPDYQRLGGIYWPDGEQTNAWTHWDKAGVAPRGPCGLETGLYVLHKRIAWEPMLLAEWYDDHPEWTHGGAGGEGGLDYGDKGPHRLAWAKLERDYVVFDPKVKHVPRLGFVQVGPDGSPMFCHRCHSKFSAEGPLAFPTTPQHAENARHGLPGEDAAFAFLDELRSLLAGSTRPAGLG